MKNNLKFGLILILAITTMAFTNISERNVDASQSKVTWKGYKVTGQHEGAIDLKEGKLTFENNVLKGGHFVIDMTTLGTTDLEGSSKGKLDGHLKSDDFFGVEKFPTASLKITKVENKGHHFTVTGDLTIKNITNAITFDMIVKDNSASAALKIDRSKFDVRYGSPSFFNDLQDKAIYDEFDINVNLVF